MANTASYKQRNRQDRRAVLESDFSKGMMASSGLVDEGYLKSLVNFSFNKETHTLVPRPALRPCHIIIPDMTEPEVDENEEVLDPNEVILDPKLSVKDVKTCVENGNTYYQFVLGLADEEDASVGKLFFVTSVKSDVVKNIDVSDDYSFNVDFSGSYFSEIYDAKFYTSALSSIHSVPLERDSTLQVEFPVGTFAFGNSYYFFGTDSKLYRSSFSHEEGYYSAEELLPKEPTVTEAVSYGYNMLRGSQTYVFTDQHTSQNFQFEGILPYNADGTKLLMTPKKNQNVLFRAYYNVLDGKKYDIVWEWRETTSTDWTLLQTDKEVTFGSSTVLQASFQPPAKDMMIRVAAYPYTDINGNTTSTVSDTVEKAIVVGFDFSVENYGAASTLDQKNYDLSTATGMEAWNGRIVLWGLPEDPTILFISDYNDPSYFPYPNNITVFDEPIIYAVEFMDSLIVFTIDKIYQVTRADDGNSWQSTVIQSHLSIDVWDKHLIQTVRNMLYFKSGNYYYMMVPKARSTTGELTLAPITTPITSFFDNFSVSVQTIVEETYGYTGLLSLITYYNFLDYEDIHNIYIFKTEATEDYLHFDILYNTVDRTWKIWLYQAAQPIFPIKHNATETGRFAIASIFDTAPVDEAEYILRRFIQIFCLDSHTVAECYLPNHTDVLYDPDQAAFSFNEMRVIVPPDSISEIREGAASDGNDVLVIKDEYADARGTTVYLLGASEYYSGYSIRDFKLKLEDIYLNPPDVLYFRNYQFLDSGYRRDEYQSKKRYRELQLEINNLDQGNLDFGMEFILDNSPRRILYKYDSSYAIDEFNPEYGVVYIDSTPFFETNLNDIDLMNQWTIDQEIIPDVSLWKVRVAISGKGSAPRLKLFSRNSKRFELIGVNWISRIMHMR